MHSFSTEDLLQYLYKETSPEKTVAIMNSLETDAELREKLETLAATKKRLDLLRPFSPSQDTVDKILEYSKNSSKK
jgi:uroporphyrinogen-III synthase